MWPSDHEELVWATLTHLKMPPERFLSVLADEVPEAKQIESWLVRCNPLLQLRSVLVDYESDWVELCPSGAYSQLLGMLIQHETLVTDSGNFDSGIYSRKKFVSDEVWVKIRELSAAAILEADLPDWEVPECWSYRGKATWDEIEDDVFGAIQRGENPKLLPWVRKHNTDLWE